MPALDVIDVAVEGMAMFEVKMDAATSQPGATRGRRWRLVAVGLAIAATTGGSGFVIGRAAAPARIASVAAPAAEQPDAATTAAPDATDDTDATRDTPASPVLTVPVADAPADPGGAEPSGAFDGGSIEAGSFEGGSMPPYSGGPFGSQYSANAWPEPELELIAERMTASGTTMRAHMIHNEIDPSAMFGQIPTDGWTPAGWCYPIGTLRVGVTTPTSTNIVWTALYSEPRGGLAVTTFASGYAEGSPVFGIVAQVADDVESVAFTTAGGLIDMAEPAGGIAMLIVDGPIEQDFSVTLTRRGGVTENYDVAKLSAMGTDDEYRAACEPPPPVLPPAGQQPDDPDAARVAVLESWRIAHDLADAEPDRRLAYVDDDTGLVSAWNALHDGQYREAALTASADIDELVFTSSGEAWFRYDVETSIANFPNRYGIARLGDAGLDGKGVWRITRQTICQDIALAPGFGCSPAVTNVFPPSATGNPRYDGSAIPAPPLLEPGRPLSD